MILNWKLTKEDAELVERIAARMCEFAARAGMKGEQGLNMMDISAVHLNGCPLDLKGLLEADTFNFTHDAFGIVRHLDRSTGQLLDCFVPRFAAFNGVAQ
jgi:hypothetical protein